MQTPTIPAPRTTTSNSRSIRPSPPGRCDRQVLSLGGAMLANQCLRLGIEEHAFVPREADGVRAALDHVARRHPRHALTPAEFEHDDRVRPGWFDECDVDLNGHVPWARAAGTQTNDLRTQAEGQRLAVLHIEAQGDVQLHTPVSFGDRAEYPASAGNLTHALQQVDGRRPNEAGDK